MILGPIQRILLSRVDLTDQTFSANFRPDLERLRSSIRYAGLIHPVLLRERPEGCQIISGFRRVSVFRELGYPEIDARIACDEGSDDLKLFTLSLHENRTTRGFNSVEKAMVLEKLVVQFKLDRPAVIREYMPLLDLETNEKILNTFLSLAQMEEEIKSYVLREQVSRSNIRRLAGFSAEDREAARTFLEALNLGENSLREVLTLVEEISKRTKTGVKETLAHPDIRDVLLHPDLTSTQKTERAKKILVDLRYPRLSRLEEEFETKKKGWNLPPHVSIHHAPFFEGKEMRVGFRFRSLEEYESVLSSLSKLGATGSFQEVLEESESLKS